MSKTSIAFVELSDKYGSAIDKNIDPYYSDNSWESPHGEMYDIGFPVLVQGRHNDDYAKLLTKALDRKEIIDRVPATLVEAQVN